MTRPGDPCGMLLVDKPLGMTSHDVVSWARRRLGTRRVGHAGTLDPLASGLLPLLVGPATRLVSWLHSWPKTYVGLVHLGQETETGDLEGLDVAGLSCAPLPPPAVLAAAVARLSGPQMQVPPAYSAKKIGGMASHRLARHGVAQVLPAVAITVHRLRVVPAGPCRLAFAARVSSGTYIRSLARDLGRLLGTGACLASLRRTGIGPLRAAGALRATRDVTPEEVAAALRPVEDVPLPLSSVRLDEGAVDRFRGGRPVAGPEAPPGPVRVLAGERLEGLGEIGPDGLLQPRVVFFGGTPGAGRAADGRFQLAEPGREG